MSKEAKIECPKCGRTFTRGCSYALHVKADKCRPQPAAPGRPRKQSPPAVDAPAPKADGGNDPAVRDRSDYANGRISGATELATILGLKKTPHGKGFLFEAPGGDGTDEPRLLYLDADGDFHEASLTIHETKKRETLL